MADSNEMAQGAGSGVPDPSNLNGWTDWLAQQPSEWSVVLASRAAMRVLPLLDPEISTSIEVLSVFRATAIARFVSKYPSRAAGAPAAAGAASKLNMEEFRAFAASRSGGRGFASSAFASSALASSAIGRSAVGRSPAATALTASSITTMAAMASAAAAASDDSSALELWTDVNVWLVDGAAASYSLPAAAATITAMHQEAEALFSGGPSSEQIAAASLWRVNRSNPFEQNWQHLKSKLLGRGEHWSVWTNWYDDVLAGTPYSEAEDAAFTDIPGDLPWKETSEAVNTEIIRRLRAIWSWKGRPSDFLGRQLSKAETVHRLAEVASPQPSINDGGQLDAGPNKAFDVPVVDEDLSTLPLRQRKLIERIVKILPPQAPPALQEFLRSYDEELKTRGTQPIIGLLKDDADIIAASVAAPRAEDEWLEAGVREAFDRFADNHAKFVEHFPLDAEREKIYSETAVDENKAAGKDFSAPFEGVAKAAKQAHDAGLVTGDFLAATQGMSETAQVLSTLPPARETEARKTPSPDIALSENDRIVPVTTKQRVVLNGLGFYSGADQRLADTANMVTIASAAYPPLATALKSAVDALSKFLNLPG
ncbi:hypothetical protein SR870_16520 [Rhodopseudomonas palustris]|uniref:hypothetical protein n=1 Tax=Rhodopseudomonas palustris TaxID=1076 RepID=UPI002ACDCFB6|nr:hypothetical protein [Rhodopseudomonas palustris]WQG98300.1 hypothetical protein SR870_16520 [Rhodopseudomonas palustris]